MGTEENRLLVRRFYEEVVNTGNVEGIATFVAADCVETDGKVRVVSGVMGMANHVVAVREVYPDLHLTVERQIAEGDWVVTLVTARGTHRGTWLGMKPTGQQLVFTAVNVDRVRDGRRFPEPYEELRRCVSRVIKGKPPPTRVSHAAVD